jgi:hypothetical protein
MVQRLRGVLQKVRSPLDGNITRRVSSCPLIGGKVKYNINHYFFNNYIKESAYWAGFLAADGNIGKAKSGEYIRVRLYLGIKDAGHLFKFKEALGSEHKVKEDHARSRASFEFYSKQMSEDLFRLYNIGPQKSLTYQPPYDIPEEFVKYFIRGYFDGDGCICETFTNKRSTTSSLITTCLGTNEFMYWFLYQIEQALNLTIPVELQPHISGKNTYIIKFNTNLSKAFLNYLYKNASKDLRLERKYQLYDRIVNNDVRKTR